MAATHDTGSAIRGPGRVDIFWGGGPVAEREASSMKASGELYLILPK
jgi:membrane-bound lytic murein transglycosylase A